MLTYHLNPTGRPQVALPTTTLMAAML